MDERIYLRPIEDGDVAMLSSWLHQERVSKWQGDPNGWLDEVAKREGEFDFVRHFIAELEGKPFGFCQYYDYIKGGEDWYTKPDLDGVYSIDYLIGETDCLGKGYGKAMVLELLELIKLHDDAKRVVVQPDERNATSCGTLRSCGFLYDEKACCYVCELPVKEGEMADKGRKPDIQRMSASVENPLFFAMFERVTAEHKALYEIEYSGDNVLRGWNVKLYKAGRTLCRMYPQGGFFKVLVVIGRKEKERAEAMLPQMSEAARRVYEYTGEGMGQRWLMFDLSEPGALYEDVLKLVRVRRESK